MGHLLRAVAALALACALIAPALAETITVFAAASTKEALDEAARAFEAASGHKVRISYGASSDLARQIDAGAPAQIFISADEELMDYVESLSLLKRRRISLLTNSLVLIAPAAKVPRLRIAPGFALGNVYVLPGLPSEMEAMYELVEAELQRGAPIESWRRTYATTESRIVDVLRELERRHPGVRVGSYPSFRPEGTEMMMSRRSLRGGR